jgi:hypothetical protein
MTHQGRPSFADHFGSNAYLNVSPPAGACACGGASFPSHPDGITPSLNQSKITSRKEGHHVHSSH